ncbi:MAG: hypothetical protein ABR507_03590 [Actinomycetota bacterium]|nr:hypothetical protein [Actinomycetota bacterium]
MNLEDLEAKPKGPREVDAQGKAALFSKESRHDGSLLIECSTCGAHTRVTPAKLLVLALPVNLTIPFKYHHTWLKCPACLTRTWVRIKAIG